jgi:RNA polymerase sigma factor (sigma-70 family)
MGMPAADQRREAFVALVQAHRNIVRKVVHTYCWSAADRGDLEQDILAQLWRAFPRYDTGRPFPTWMYRIALNVAISWVRGDAPRRRQMQPLDPAQHDPAAPDDRQAEDDERVRALYRVIDGLEPLNRALLLLHLDEHTYRDIAAILGISETNVATKISRLKARLRQQLGGQT